MLLRKAVVCVVCALVLCSCGMFVGTPNESSSSSSRRVDLSSSSSRDPADSGRVEWDYADTLRARDTISLIAPDSQRSEGVFRYFIGRLPLGSRIRFSARLVALRPGARFQIKTELGRVQLPMEPSNLGGYRDYYAPDSSAWSTNSFALADTGYYLLEVRGTRAATADSFLPDFQALMVIDTAYYSFIGDRDSLILPENGELHGFFRLDRGEDSARFYFTAGAGKSLTLTGDGEFLSYMRLRSDRGVTLDSGERQVRYQLLPRQTETWVVGLRTVIPGWNSGNYAVFSLKLVVVQLNQGEYLDRPDTLGRIGDTLKIARVGNENSGWEVRHDHYVYLGDFREGDSLHIWYGTQGMANVQKRLRVLNAQGDVLDTLYQVFTLNWKAMTPNRLRVRAGGKLYLHYTGSGNSNTYWMDPEWTLRFQVLVQKPGALTAWSVSPDSARVAVGDTLWLKNLSVSVEPATASGNVVFWLPRGQRQIIQDSADIAAERSGYTLVGDALSSAWLLAKTPGISYLIGQSVADPQKVDTCFVVVGVH